MKSTEPSTSFRGGEDVPETAPSDPEVEQYDPLDAPTAALAATVLEVGRHVEDAVLQAPRWFALARSAELIAQQPGVAALLGIDEEALAEDPSHLTPIELEDVPSSTDPLDALVTLDWPGIACGGVLALELDASAWSSDDTGSASLGSGTLRVIVAATEDGKTYSALRSAGSSRYLLGPALVPQLAEALAESVRSPDAG